MARQPCGPFDLVTALDADAGFAGFGGDAWAAVLSERADLDDGLPARAIVRRAIAAGATRLLEEGAVRARLGTIPNVWRMLRRGHAGGAAYLAFDAPVCAPLLQGLAPLDGSRALPIGEGLAFALEVGNAIGVLAQGVTLTHVVQLTDVHVRADGTALVTAAPGPQPVLEVRAPLWTLAPENRRTMFMGPPRPHVYATAMVAYVAITGRQPFLNDGPALQSHALVPVRQAAPDVPPLVDEVLSRALAERPDDRHESLEELLADLTRCTQEVPGVTAAERARSADDLFGGRFRAFAAMFAPPG
jgi:hypothetical protein